MNENNTQVVGLWRGVVACWLVHWAHQQQSGGPTVRATLSVS